MLFTGCLHYAKKWELSDDFYKSSLVRKALLNRDTFCSIPVKTVNN